MPLTVNDNTPDKFPNPTYLTLANWKRGVITLVNAANAPNNCLVEADNIILVEDGQPRPRPGIQWYGAITPNNATIDGFNYFDYGGAVHLVVAAGGNIYRSINDGVTWTICTGAIYTAGTRVNMTQYNSLLYLTDGVDAIILYSGTTTLTQYTPLTTPAAATATVSSALTGTGFTVYYKISAVNTIGFTIASPSVSVTINAERTSWVSTTQWITLAMPTFQTGQTRYDIYYSVDNLNFYYLDSSTTNSYQDNGTAIEVPSTIAPTGNTTQGPLSAQLRVVGNRLFGVRDPNNPYRIWFSSGSYPLGSFSDAYDGGYLDWQPGGKFRPVQVEDYRDGKGQSMATVWMNSADEQGCIVQMSLGTLTVGNLSVTVPTAYKLPGSRGTPSPYSVVSVLNDYVFYNEQGFYNLGNRPDLLEILSTDETSANIRPTVRTINPGAASGICALYYDAKVYISVPYNSAANNATAIYDTELQAWLPTAYTVGFSQFLRYTDSSGVPHLLATKPGDKQITEVGTIYGNTILGDYGQPIQTNLLTGLYPTEKDRYDFQYTYEMEFEFSNPQGAITMELLGIEHASGFGSIKIVPFMPSSTTATSSVGGWDTFNWDVYPWDNATSIPPVVSETSSKRYSVINKELNAVQWHISTSSLNSYYILRSLQTWGTDTQDAHPASWRLSGS